jgi:carbon starvation protein
MAQIFAGAFGSHLTALWYHFAIMFEALFILTTVDTGTRVGRFMFQELAGHVWAPMGRTSWYPSTVIASAAVVAGWGWFLIQGVQDPLGGINTLWPLFGISNQLLAAIALAVGTTVLVRSGKARFAWVTLLPLAWLLLVTLTAGWQKIFAADPRLGFLSHAAATAAGVVAGAIDPSRGARLVFNDRLNVAIAALFMSVVVLVVISSARVWLGILRGQAPATTQETPYVESSYAA